MSKIEWIGPTGKTWNPVAGCSMVHDGCKHCYALTMSARLQLIGQEKYKGTTERLVLISDGTTEWRADWETFDKACWKGKARWARIFRPWPDHLGKPLEWKSGRSIFVNSMSDLFGEGVLDEYIAAVFAVMAATPQHKYVILTKRPTRAVEWFRWFDERVDRLHAHIQAGRRLIANAVVLANEPLDIWPSKPWVNKLVVWLETHGCQWPLPNVAIGVSVSDQASADEFLPLLAQIPTVAPIVSVEPMLGPVDLSRLLCIQCKGDGVLYGSHSSYECDSCEDGWNNIDWLSWIAQVIIGAESGPGARPVKIEWVRDLARQVLDAQTTAQPQEQNPDPELSGYVETGPPVVVSGPSLFVKQWPVCEQCVGWPSGTIQLDNGTGRSWDCDTCENTGQSRPAMTRKREADKTPRLHVPGYSAHNWTQGIQWPT